MPKLDAHDIIKTIAESKKKTPVKVYVKGDLASLEVPEELDAYFGDKAGVLFGDWKDAEKFLRIILKLPDITLKTTDAIPAFRCLTRKNSTLESNRAPLFAIKSKSVTMQSS